MAKTDGTSGVAFTSAEGRQKLHEVFIDEVTQKRSFGWMALGQMFCFMSPTVEALLIKYITVDKPQLINSATGAGAFESGMLSSVYGIRVLVDPTLQGSSAAAGTGQFPFYFGIMGESLMYAGQIRSSEPLRAQNLHADLYRSLYVYGATVLDTNKTEEYTFTFTT